MIWLSYRQTRLQLTIGLAALVVAVAALALTGPHLADLAKDPEFLSRAAQEKINSFLYVTSILLTYAVPALIGAFWGAPLVAREVEAGTHRLAWTQGISRTRWLAFRLGVAATAVIVVSGLLTLAISWWAAPIDRAVPKEGSIKAFSFTRISPFLFSVRGVVPVGYALFALALGVVLGLVLRRTLIALGLTIALLVVVQVCVPMFVRAHLAAPLDNTIAITVENLTGLQGAGGRGSDFTLTTFHVSGVGAGDWLLKDETVDKSGSVPAALPAWVDDCMPKPGKHPTGSDEESARFACFARLADEGYRQHVVYHPSSAFWTLQARETGLLLGCAALLTGFAFWRIRRDL
jgi:hypothetical protein